MRPPDPPAERRVPRTLSGRTGGLQLLVDSLMLVAGLALLLAGGEATVRGGAALARELGFSPLVIGLTVVAFGTSAPELAVNVTAALRGDGGVAFGNLIGSNLANVGLILGGVALLRTLPIESSVVTRELPMMLLAAAATAIMGIDALRGEAPGRYDRAEGLVLLLLFSVFLYYTIAETLGGRAGDPFLDQASTHGPGGRPHSLAGDVGLLVVGIATLTVGGHLTVAGAVDLAAGLGVPKALIGLTIVAVGTSLPELAASLVAAYKNEADLAVGNVVGSNLFNLLFVFGLTASIDPVEVPPGGLADLAALLASTVLLLFLAYTRRHVSRPEGALLLVAYLGYVTWRVG